jgi:hypothetical protein
LRERRRSLNARSRFEDHDLLSSSRQTGGGQTAGDAGADNDDVS